MAKFTFSAESDDLGEIAAIINAATGGAVSHVAIATATAEQPIRGSTAEEAAAPKATRGRKGKAEEAPAVVGEPTGDGATAAPAESASEAVPATAAGDDEHPMLRNYSQSDIKDKAGEMMKRDPKMGAKIMTALEERFSVSRFGEVADTELNRCMAMLEELEG